MSYFAAFLMGLFLTVIMIPGFKKLAIRLDFVDRPTERKQHKEPVPHLASLGIFIGFTATYWLFAGEVNKKMIGLLIGSLMIMSIGIVDDWYKTKHKELHALPKLIVQLGGAVVAYQSGVVFYGFTNPFTQTFIVLPVLLQFSLTITWIFGVTTVINFIDGLDGLAGGIGAISGATLFVVALAKGQGDSALMSIILVAVLVGYLRYNKSPAQIYMGDAGATLVGYLLGVIAVGGAFKQATLLSLFIPILALGVPIFDNIFVVLKRIKEGKPVYLADRSQVHYRLLNTGLKPPQVVIFLCLVNACFGLLSIILLMLPV